MLVDRRVETQVDLIKGGVGFISFRRNTPLLIGLVLLGSGSQHFWSHVATIQQMMMNIDFCNEAESSPEVVCCVLLFERNGEPSNKSSGQSPWMYV